MNGTAENSWLARQLPAAELVAEFVRRDRHLDGHVITPHLCVPTPNVSLVVDQIFRDRDRSTLDGRPGDGRAANQVDRHLREVANVSLIFRRARESLVFTLASLMPSACTVSAILSCCTSRNTNTVRYLSGSEFTALISASRSSFCSNASDGISRQSARSFGI